MRRLINWVSSYLLKKKRRKEEKKKRRKEIDPILEGENRFRFFSRRDF